MGKRADTICRILLITAAGLGVGACLGGIIGGAVGWRLAFHEQDGASEIVFQAGTGQPVPEFWIAAFNNENEPMLLRLEDVGALVTPWTVRLPTTHGPVARGPWEGNMPRGDHPFHSGGMSRSFALDDARDHAELVLYRSDVEGGWIRFYYVYEIRSGAITPRLVRRERMGNDWGTLIMMGSVIQGVAIGSTSGLALSLIGGGVSVSRRARSDTDSYTHWRKD